MANKMINCKSYGAEIAASAKTCPKCGAKNKKPIYKKWWFYVLVLLIVAAVAGGSGGGKTVTQQVGTVSQTQSTGGKPQSSGDKQSSTKPSEPTPEPKTIYNVGDILQDGNVQIVYMASGDYVSDNQFLQPGAGNKYIFLEFAFNNTGKSDTSISAFSFECYADGYNVDMFYGGEEPLSATLSSGRSTTGKIYFEVPADAKEIEIEYTPNAFFDRKIKFVYEGNLNSGYVPEADTSRTEDALHVGEIYEASSLRISYLNCENYVSDNMYVQPKAGFHYVSLSFEFENLGSSDRMISSFSFDCYADGAACDGSYFRDDDLQATISAGRKAKGTVTFEVPDNAEVIEVEFNNNVWTSDRIAFVVK